MCGNVRIASQIPHIAMPCPDFLSYHRHSSGQGSRQHQILFDPTLPFSLLSCFSLSPFPTLIFFLSRSLSSYFWIDRSGWPFATSRVGKGPETDCADRPQETWRGVLGDRSAGRGAGVPPELRPFLLDGASWLDTGFRQRCLSSALSGFQHRATKQGNRQTVRRLYLVVDRPRHGLIPNKAHPASVRLTSPIQTFRRDQSHPLPRNGHKSSKSQLTRDGEIMMMIRGWNLEVAKDCSKRP